MYFDELDLNDNVLDALYDMHFDTCTPVQEKCIPEILQGRDMLGVAQTGTGKTAAYLLPIMSKLDDGGYPKDAINCVIMSPTRELAQQIDQAMQGFGCYLQGVSSVAIYGGNDGNRYDQELKSLSLGADIVIATPGRLISHMSLGNADFSRVSFFVLDEADRMLDMGFSEDIKKIAKQLPPTCQTIMFSATMPDKIEDLAKTLLKDPVVVKLAVSKPAEKIKQSAYVCYETQKMGIVKDIFKAGDLKRVIVFSGKKQKVKLINRALLRMHINSGEMHSDLDQAERDQMLYKFKSGQIDVLVATDILARGIDIDDIAMVINYDVPHDAEDYVHRIGRTARADRDGVAITFISDEDMYYFKQIEKMLEKEVTKNPLPEELGEGPDYNASGKQRSSAKSRRRKDRDATAHKHKPRQNGNDRKPKERAAKPVAEGEQMQNAPQENAAETTETQNQTPREGKKEPRRDRNRDRNQRSAQAVGNAPADEQAAKPADNQEGQGKSRRRNNHRRRGDGDGQKPETQNQEAQKQGNNGQKQANNGQKQGNNAPKQGNTPKQGEGKKRDNNAADAAKRGDRPQRNNDAKAGTNRNRKPRSQRPAPAADAPRRDKNEGYKPQSMSPVVNPSKESGLKAMLKKPLNWIKKIGK